MLKKIILFIFFVSINKIDSSIDPLSKITVTSKSATCIKDKNLPNLFVFNYIDDVDVTFADGSKINSDELSIELDTTNFKKNIDPTQTNTTKQVTKNDISQFKKITFKNNVHFVRENRTVDADTAELFLDKQQCKLINNVVIKQIKENPKDLPIISKCNIAILNMKTEQVTFLGNNQKPVSTTIEIAGKPGILKKIKSKDEKKAEKKRSKKEKKADKKKSKKNKNLKWI